MKSLKPKKNKKIYIILPATVLLLAIGVLFALEKTHTTDFIKLPGNANLDANAATTTSNEPSAQNDFTDGKEKDIVNSDKNEGTVTDTGGNVSTTPPKNEWLTSADGKTSVYSPVNNSILSSGQSLSGESASETVSFRLIDNVSGVIAQGKIAVVNGKFSGKFDFSTTASEGRLDIFVAALDGTESSVVEISIKFSP